MVITLYNIIQNTVIEKMKNRLKNKLSVDFLILII